MSRTVLLMTGLLLGFIAAGLGFYLQQRFSTPTDPSAPPQLPAAESLQGKPRPDFALPDTAGVMRRISEWDGKVVVVNFWATWCPPCREEMPMFAKLQEEYGERGVQFVGIATEETDTVIPFLEEMQINYPILTGTQEAIRVAELYGNRLGALPYTVIIDRSKVIIYTKTGPMHREEIEAIIGSVL